MRLTADQQLFFAPVLGFGRSSPVASEATASWGGAGVAEKIPGGQIDMDGDPCPPNSGTSCSPDKYDIIGFTQMRITHLYKGNTTEAETYCVSRIPGASASPNARCMRAVWFDYTTEGLNPMGGENFGLVPVQLIA